MDGMSEAVVGGPRIRTRSSRPMFCAAPAQVHACASATIERHIGAKIPRMSHQIDEHVLTLFLAPGSIEHRLEDQAPSRITIPAGATVLSMRGRRETITAFAPLDVLTIALSPETLDRAGASALEPSSGIADRRFQRLMFLVEEQRRLGFPTGDIFLDGVTQAMVALLAGPRASSGDLRPCSARMARAREIIEDNVDAPLGLHGIAEMLGVSTVTFGREFKGAFGETPHRYALGRRLERCKELLARTGQPVTEIALAAGFQSSQHMATVFRAMTGVTPTTFRALARA